MNLHKLSGYFPKTFKGRIILSYVFFCIILSTVVLTTFFLNRNLTLNTSEELNRLNEKIKINQQLNSAVVASTCFTKNYLTDEKPIHLSDIKETWRNEIDPRLNHIKIYALETSDPLEKKLLDSLHICFANFKTQQNKLIRQASANQGDRTEQLTGLNFIALNKVYIEDVQELEILPSAAHVLSLLQVIESRDEASLKSAIAMLNENSFSNSIWIFLLYFISLSMVMSLAFVFGKEAAISVKKIKTNISEISKGNIPAKVEGGTDDLGDIINYTNTLIENLENVKHFSNEVGKGNFETNYAVFNNEGDLGGSLAGMRESLKKVAEEDKVRNWATTGLAQIGIILRNNTETAEELYFNIISFLVKYMDANQGGIFIINNDEESEPYLELVSCYAYDRKKYVDKRINIGDGLIGQAVLEKEIIYLSDIPQNYLEITSGLGGSTPKSVIIVPLKVNEEVHGVIEIASFHVMEEQHLEFIKKLAESIASTVSGVKVGERTKRLLEQSQKMTEEMRSQEEELRQNMEEMEATQEEMKRLQEESHAQTNIINSIAIVSKTDLKGNITYVNEEFLKWSKYTLEEVMGKNHRFLKSGDQDDKIFEDMWATISSGKIFRGEIKNKAKDGTFYWVDAIIAPILDANGKPKEYMAQRFVINEQKEKEEAIMQSSEDLRAQEEELRQNMEEMQSTQELMEKLQDEMKAQTNIINSIAIVSKTDLKGNITYVNDEFLKWSKYTLEEVMGRNHRFLKSGDQDDKIFEDMWATISSGKIFRGEIKNKAKDGSIYWVDAIIAPILDENGKPKEYMAQRFVINEQKKREEEIQQSAEELRAQEEELRQNMEEMQSTQELMQRLSDEMKAQNSIINSIAIVSKTDIKGNITYVNDEFLKWSKYTLEEVMGRNHRFLKSGDQDDKIFEDMWATISSGRTFRGEIKNKAKDGSIYWVDAIIAPILDENGKPKEYMAQRFVINEQKQKEEAMQQSQEELRAQEEELRQNMEEMEATQEEMQRLSDEMKAQNSIINSIAIVSKTDLKGNITYVNEEFLKWSKYTLEEVMGKNHRFLKSGDQDDKIFEDLWATISSGRTFRGEIKNKAKDGSIYWVDAIIAPVLDDKGKPKEYIAQRFVINEQKQKEEAMQQGQEELQRLQEEIKAQTNISNYAAIVSKTDLKGNITSVNDEFLKWSKYTLEEVIGKNPRFLKTGEQDDKIFDDLWPIISSGKTFRGEIKNKDKDGIIYWVDVIITPVLDENGKPKEYIAHRFVIDGPKEKEERLSKALAGLKILGSN
jgi:PAS domain S-box-containing protein